MMIIKDTVPCYDNAMTEDEFDKTWTTVTDKDDCDMLDWSDVKKYPSKQRWTWIDGDEDDRTYLIAGDHYVNRFAHAATTTPWVTGDEIMVLAHD